ncbi:hypothetical protein BN130_3431 [Cronobacter malonaticus 507]|nr:hypothetical protein BN130_3431 [Cronobacter malonaticus 507]
MKFVVVSSTSIIRFRAGPALIFPLFKLLNAPQRIYLCEEM